MDMAFIIIAGCQASLLDLLQGALI
jgi:hypothetical protein